MNLETKITIYKFTPQLFTLTLYSSLYKLYYRHPSACEIKQQTVFTGQRIFLVGKLSFKRIA